MRNDSRRRRSITSLDSAARSVTIARTSGNMALASATVNNARRPGRLRGINILL